ncbi:PQQ-binding-like beta-propeller repeat protein, partial [bacterium]|nr:PQQ-binding-like beta-propeller repeat protein [bacterium]
MRPRMTTLLPMHLVLACLSISLLFPDASVVAGSAPDPEATAQAHRILKATGITGGLVVHVGCGDGSLTAALHADDGTLVQGLDTSAESIGQARKYLSDRGLYGKVTARTFDGRTLPYRDNMVNLVVVSDPKCRVPDAEIMRVLAPQGVAYAAGKKQVKPRPGELDEWTHYHHDPQGTMVGLDRVVGPPRGIQWVGDPKWLRNHDFMSSMHAMVSAGGRVFYVIDEGLRNHIFLPSKWVLIARDAFNGTVLWRRPLKDWHPNNWPLKSGPGQFPRRLVAVGDRVFVTFGQTAPLTALDAVTGKTVRTYDGTQATEEVILADGTLYLLVRPGRKPIDYKAAGTSYKEIGRASNRYAWTPGGPQASVMAVEAETGRTLWKHDSPVAPLSLTVSDKKVFFANGTGMVALDRGTGKPLWTSQWPAIKRVGTG